MTALKFYCQAHIWFHLKEDPEAPGYYIQLPNRIPSLNALSFTLNKALSVLR
jgi:hypothetical protein